MAWSNPPNRELADNHCSKQAINKMPIRVAMGREVRRIAALSVALRIDGGNAIAVSYENTLVSVLHNRLMPK